MRGRYGGILIDQERKVNMYVVTISRAGNVLGTLVAEPYKASLSDSLIIPVKYQYFTSKASDITTSII